jgi:hypothetical protein
MGYTRKGAAALAAAALLAGLPAGAQQSTLETAEKLRRLDIMLMVTALRCRFGDDNFQADYEAFSARHLGTLNGAARDLTAELARRHGASGANRALDRMSTGIANGYGMGHPLLECAELKRTTQELTGESDRAALVAAAERLIELPQESVFLLARR